MKLLGISRVAQDYTGGVRIAVIYAQGIIIEQNQVSDLPYTGISVGWGWTDAPTALQDNLVRENAIYRVMQLHDDGAGIYAARLVRRRLPAGAGVEVVELAAGGLALAIHAIGDRANRQALDALEAAIRSGAGRGLRHRVEHVQTLHPADIPRFGALGVIASMQPIHATSDMDMADRYWGERARLSYAWRTMWDSGALVVFLKPGATVDAWIDAGFDETQIYASGTSTRTGAYQLNNRVEAGQSYAVIVVHDDYLPVREDLFQAPPDAADPFVLDVPMQRR